MRHSFHFKQVAVVWWLLLMCSMGFSSETLAGKPTDLLEEGKSSLAIIAAAIALPALCFVLATRATTGVR